MPTSKPEQALTDEDRKLINQHLDELARLQTDIELAIKADCATNEHSLHCKNLRSQLELLKATYFPGKP